MDARTAAFTSLMRCEKENRFSNLEVDSAIKKYSLMSSERALYTALVYGTIERRISLDYYISAFSSVPIDKLEPKVHTILRLGFLQVIYLDKIPDRAAVNESVELAKKQTHRGTHGFVNAVMRALVRSKDKLPCPDREREPGKYMSVRYSVPEWLWDMWSSAYGEERAERILRAFDENPKVTLRVNTLKTTRDELLAAIPGAIACTRSKNGFALGERVPPTELEALADGLCFVQDEASQLCAAALGARPGETVLDCCACPGGKSFSIAMDMENKGRIDSYDLHSSKLSLVDSGAKKLGITNIKTGEKNAYVFDPELEERYDRILCDVPCSGLGVIAKKPELRYKAPRDIERLPDIQYRILENSAKYLKHGGVLIYSTCTLNPEENEKNVERFLSAHPEFEPSPELMPDDGAICTIFPDAFGSDGFFIARLRKRSNI